MGEAVTLTPDIAQASRFLQLLDPSAEGFTFRCLDDMRLANGKPRDQAALRQTFHGTFPQHVDQLQRLNVKFGAAVYVTINRTDLHGHQQGHILAKRAFWVDLDNGLPQTFQLRPSIIVQTSPGKYQAYWLITGEVGDADFIGTLRHMALTYGADPGVNSVERILRLPGFYHRKGEPFQVTIIEATGHRYSLADIAAVHPPLQEQRKAEPIPEEIPDSSRNKTLISAAGTLRRRGFPATAIEAALQVLNTERCSPPLDPKEVSKIANSAGHYSAGSLVKEGPINWPETKDDVPAPRSAANVAAYLGHLGIVVWASEFDGRYYIEGYQDFDTLTEEALRSLRILAESYHLRTPKDAFDDYIMDLAWQDRRHPVREYLALLEWDGVPRVRTWLATYVGAHGDDTAYIEAVGMLTLVAAVQRVRNPGCKFDFMPVLEGRQDLGKSSVWRILASDPWFTANLLIGADPKIIIEQTRGRWIIEHAELDGITGRDVERIKSFITNQEDSARLAYGRTTSSVRRQFILTGTTNNAQYLRDETGNRRFLPIRCGKVDFDRLTRDRDQLWAEAAAMCSDWRMLDLPASIKPLAIEAQAQRQITDPIEDRVATAVAGIGAAFVRTEDILAALGAHKIEEQRRLAIPLGRIMQKLGFQKAKRRDGGATARNGYHKGGPHALLFVWNPAEGKLIPDPDNPAAKLLQ
jgi:hypothetical protein